jgi:dipeptidyl aminopeptidase/acylaminoacyl peptidase
MTTWLLSHDGEGRFRAGCSERAANDLLSLERASDIATAFRSYTGVSHVERPEPLVERSPLTYAASITAPVLVVHSEGDIRCPIDQGDSLFTALRSLGRPVEYLRFPGESHELSRSGAPRHRIERAEAIIEWFDRWLR